MKNTIESNLFGARFDFNNLAILFSDGIFTQDASCEIWWEPLKEKLNCVEQGIQLSKARLFGDKKAYAAILKSEDAAEQTAIGDTIENVDNKAWGKVFLQHVIDLNFEKFKQNSAWRELLLITDRFEIVYAVPTDNIWGIGVAANDPLILDKANWKGQNLLGKALMNARVKLTKELTLIETVVESTEVDETWVDIPDVGSIEDKPYTGKEDEVTKDELQTFLAKTEKLLEENS
jgi:ribA/ribD-fused uncharacterized protein